MNASQFSSHIGLQHVCISDPFWTGEIELVRREVIPYQYEALHDRIEGAEKSYAIENFVKAGRVAAAIKRGEQVPVYPVDQWVYTDKNADPNAFHGWVFQDSDVYKWLEAVGYSLAGQPDTQLEAQAKAVIDLVCAAQLENGYLDTLYIINDREKVFSNLRDFHELYCFGHLAEAAVSIYHGIGHRKLLDAACRFADLICRTFGVDGIKGYPGHEIAEMALVKLYDVTGQAKYLEMARFFLDERGKQPHYYDAEHGTEAGKGNYQYCQAHCQPKDQQEAVGHAVRAVYLYSGMADVAKRSGDTELSAACGRLMVNIMDKKLYITGGIGATVDGEAFSFDYDLPNDLAYSETCASIGLVFFARRMMEMAPDARIADTLERALYNTVLAGMALDGKSFFYVNPLEVLPEASRRDSRKRHVQPVRQKWFGCACCPPNLARLITSVGAYCYTENQDTLFVHQYVGSRVSAKHADLTVESDYLTSGKVTIHVQPRKTLRLALRIPAWCGSYRFSRPCRVQDGYAYFNVEAECRIEAAFDLEPKLIRCSGHVRANVGKVAVTRGPFVYCLEEVDNGKDLQLLRISPQPNFSLEDGKILADGFREEACEALYTPWQTPEWTPVRLTFVPYYSWGNRGENEMQVYVRI